MIDRRFLIQVAVVVLIGGGAGGWLVSRYGSAAVSLGFAVGLLMSTLNAVAGSWCIGYGFDKPQNTFLKVVFGGMFVRMGTLLAGFFVLIAVFHLDTISLTVSLLGFYLIFLVMEILSIQRRMAEKAS